MTRFHQQLIPIAPQIYSVPGLGLGRVYVLADADGLTLDRAYPGLRHLLRRLATVSNSLGAVRRILVIPRPSRSRRRSSRCASRHGRNRVRGSGGWTSVSGPVPSRLPVGGATYPLWRRLGWSLRLPAARVNTVLGEGDSVPEVLDGRCVLVGPGHTPSHLAFWQPDRGVLFCGDVLVNGRRLHLPSPTWTADMRANCWSLARLADLDARLVCTGHGPPLARDAARRVRALATWALRTS